MKTGVIMQRVLGNHAVRQGSKDSMFNANDLLSIYNSQLTDKRKKRRLDSYLSRDGTQETIEALMRRLNSNNTKTCYLLDNIIRTSRGSKGGTWMHPYLFIDFAMWLSVDFKVMCIEWIYDHLIKLRNDVGDEYKDFTASIKEHLKPTDIEVYKSEIGMINKLVFGSTDRGQRQIATQDQLSLLKTLQKADIKLMSENKTYSERMASLHRMKELL